MILGFAWFLLIAGAQERVSVLAAQHHACVDVCAQGGQVGGSCNTFPGWQCVWTCVDLSACSSLGNKEDEFRMPYLSHQQLPAGILPMVPEVAQAVGVSQGHHTKDFTRAAPNPAKATVTAMIARELLYGGTSPTAETILKNNISSGHVPHGPLTRPSEQLDYLSRVQGFQVTAGPSRGVCASAQLSLSFSQKMNFLPCSKELSSLSRGWVGQARGKGPSKEGWRGMEGITSLRGKRKSLTFDENSLNVQADSSNNKSSDLVVATNLDFGENRFLVLALSAW